MIVCLPKWHKLTCRCRKCKLQETFLTYEEDLLGVVLTVLCHECVLPHDKAANAATYIFT